MNNSHNKYEQNLLNIVGCKAITRIEWTEGRFSPFLRDWHSDTGTGGVSSCKLFAVDISCSLLTISCVTKTHKRFWRCLFRYVFSRTICFKIIRNGKWKMLVAEISDRNSSHLEFWMFYRKVSYLCLVFQDFQPSKQIFRGKYCKSIASLIWVQENDIFEFCHFRQPEFWK